MLPGVTRVEPLGEYRLRLIFTDGFTGEVDLRSRIADRGGVFAALEDTDLFGRIQVDREAGTIAWPNGVDLCPDVVYSLVTGKPIPGAEQVTRR